MAHDAALGLASHARVPRRRRAAHARRARANGRGSDSAAWRRGKEITRCVRRSIAGAASNPPRFRGVAVTDDIKEVPVCIARRTFLERSIGAVLATSVLGG